MVKRRNIKFEAKLAREVEKAKVIGAEKGRMQVDKVKFNWNNIGLQVKKRILELDPSVGSRFVATIGVAMALKKGLDWSTIAIEQFLWLGSYSNIPFLNFLGIVTGDSGTENNETVEVGSEISKWLISYGLAYLIVEHFGEIVTAVGTGLTSIVGLGKTLLGAGLVPV